MNRGYTGHEHLDMFGAINMNGRVYDPATAQFFSPDPFVQSAGNWANYNRYSYGLNNPMIYTDPSGYRHKTAQEMEREKIATEYWEGRVTNFFANYRNGGGTPAYTYSGGVYRNSDGNMVGYDEVLNYLISSSYYVESYSGVQAQDIVRSYQNGESIYEISFNGNTNYVYNKGELGQVSILSNGALSFSNFNGGMTSLGLWEHGNSAGQFRGNPAGQGSDKSEPWLTVNFNRGILQIETNFIDKDWGAITPGPFIVYSKDGSKNKYYNTHEPGHVIQFLIFGPVAYYGLVAIPSLTSSTTPFHKDMPWEKLANQLWFWLTGENDHRHPLYFEPNNK